MNVFQFPLNLSKLALISSVALAYSAPLMAMQDDEDELLKQAIAQSLQEKEKNNALQNNNKEEEELEIARQLSIIEQNDYQIQQKKYQDNLDRQQNAIHESLKDENKRQKNRLQSDLIFSTAIENSDKSEEERKRMLLEKAALELMQGLWVAKDQEELQRQQKLNEDLNFAEEIEILEESKKLEELKKLEEEQKLQQELQKFQELEKIEDQNQIEEDLKKIEELKKREEEEQLNFAIQLIESNNNNNNYNNNRPRVQNGGLNSYEKHLLNQNQQENNELQNFFKGRVNGNKKNDLALSPQAGVEKKINNNNNNNNKGGNNNNGSTGWKQKIVSLDKVDDNTLQDLRTECVKATEVASDQQFPLKSKSIDIAGV